MWDLSCPDWQDRIRQRRSLVPDLPLFEDEAAIAVEFFGGLRLPDVPSKPFLRDAAGPWFIEIVEVLFGSRDPVKNIRFVEEIFALIAKKNSKTTYGAALMLTALFMNMRPLAEFLFVGPTQAISDLAFSQAVGMIEEDEEGALKSRFQVIDHLKQIKDRTNGARLKIKTFDLKILTGPRPAGILLDELHLLGKDRNASKVIRQLRGGRQSIPEGFMVITTTQSDEQPAGAFKEELANARAIRDGKLEGTMLPILYEFPEEIAKSEALWRDTANWPMVMPNLGRSLDVNRLKQDLVTETNKGIQAIKVWTSQHLNIEIGLGLKDDAWVGAQYWERCADLSLTLDTLLDRAEVVVVGIDGGGLDDLLGLCVMGRERGTKRWLVWTHAWGHEIVRERRKEILSRLEDFETDNDLTFVPDESDADIQAVADIIERVSVTGLMPEAGAIGVDPVGITQILDELGRRNFSVESGDGKGMIRSVRQGWTMADKIKTCELRLAQNGVRHTGSALMNWCVGNAKVEPRGNAVLITKQGSGSAKIDPLMAFFDAADLMMANPTAAGQSVYEERGLLMLG